MSRIVTLSLICYLALIGAGFSYPGEKFDTSKLGDSYRFAAEFEMRAVSLSHIIKYFEYTGEDVSTELTKSDKVLAMIQTPFNFKVKSSAPKEIKELLSHFEWVKEVDKTQIEFRFKEYDTVIFDIEVFQKITNEFMKLTRIYKALNAPFEPYRGISYHLHLSRTKDIDREIVEAMTDYKIAKVFSKRMEGDFKARSVDLYGGQVYRQSSMPTNMRGPKRIEDKLQVFSPQEQLEWTLWNLEENKKIVLEKGYAEILNMAENGRLFEAIINELEYTSRESNYGAQLIYRVIKNTSKKNQKRLNQVLRKLFKQKGLLDDSSKLSNFLFPAREKEDTKFIQNVTELFMKVSPDRFPFHILTSSDYYTENLPKSLLKKIIKYFKTKEDIEVLRWHAESFGVSHQWIYDYALDNFISQDCSELFWEINI